jgi:tetratricopeptide (TPR) repeat protein
MPLALWRRISRPPAPLDRLVVALAAVALYARTLAFGFTGLDDVDLVLDDPSTHAGPAGLLRALSRPYMHVVDPDHAYYRPLVTASYWLDGQWSGGRPLAYHATNVALHAAAAALFHALLGRLALGRGVALAAALLFAAHPALAAAVAWIPGRNDSLLAVFVLAAWLLFAADSERPSLASRAGHLACFALALLTKETAVVVPLVCVAHGVLVGPRPGAARWAGHAAGWAAAAGCVVLLRARAVPLGAPGVSASALLQGVPEALRGLGRLVAPLGLSVVASTGDEPLWPGVLVAIALCAATALVPAVRRRVVGLGLAAFVSLLAPALFASGTLVLDSRLYAPACGALVAVAEIWRAVAVEPRARAAFAGVAVAGFALLALGFSGAFRDRRAFARDAVAGAPHSPLAHLCLGQSYQLAGEDDRAMAEYRAALALGPAEVAHNNIAVIYMARARWPDAEEELRAELAINPRYARAYRNLAVVLRREGRDAEAGDADARATDLEK